MSPDSRLWQDVTAPYRAGDWPECIRIVRAALDANPYELAPRYLLAALYLRLGNKGLALLQYERLLPLAVGRGEMFLALAAQRRLDELHSHQALHAKRYEAMHQWFRALAARAGRRRGERTPAFGAHEMVKLTAGEFAAAAERCAVETVGLEPGEIQASTGLLWVVLHGRLRWSVVRDGTLEPDANVAGPGDIIVLPSPTGADVLLRFEPETPTECLRLDPGLFAASVSDMAERPRAGQNATEGPPPAAGERGSAAEGDSASEGESTGERGSAGEDDSVSGGGSERGRGPASAAPAEPAASAEAPAALEPALVQEAPPADSGAEPAPAPKRATRPEPDPFAEPVLAVGAPIERRRETRLSISIADGVALLGVAGTRVAPLAGALVDLSAGGMGVRFRRGDLMQSRRELHDAVIVLLLTLPDGGEPLRLAGRVAWVQGADDGAESDPEGMLQLGLEFVSLDEHSRARLQRVIEAIEPRH